MTHRPAGTPDLAAAATHHHAGRLDEAETLYLAVLRQDPQNPDALYGLGVIALQRGRHRAAADRLRRALPHRRRPQTLSNYGLALQGTGNLAAAAEAHRAALALDPAFLAAHVNLGLALTALGRPLQALARFETARRLDPSHAGIDAARGDTLQILGRAAEAATAYRAALARDPARAETFNHLGAALQDRGHLDQAVAAYRHALALRPDFAEALCNLGHGLGAQRRDAEALDAGRRAIRLHPGLATAWNNAGKALHALGRLPEAVSSYRRALRLAPADALTRANLGAALSDIGDSHGALAACRHAVTLAPDHPLGLANLGTALQDLGQPAQAETALRRALRLQPPAPAARWTLSLALLTQGRFEEGWRHYESRWQTPGFPSTPWPFAQPLWQGRPFPGRTLLLHTEQGLGDMIQFIRTLPLVLARGGTVILRTPAAMGRLLATAWPAGSRPRLVTTAEPPPPCDLHCPLMSLPLALGSAANPPAVPVPYLAAEPDRVRHWATLLPREGLRIGIAWQGNPRHKVDRGRSPPLAAFAPLARLPGVRLISLQKIHGLDQLGTRPEDMRLEIPPPPFDDGPDAFLDTAALIKTLDLVITSDTAIAHLAGALAQPVWVVLKAAADWRWMQNRSDSPWYPTMRLFRQEQAGVWEPVFAKITKEISQGRGPQ